MTARGLFLEYTDDTLGDDLMNLADCMLLWRFSLATDARFPQNKRGFQIKPIREFDRMPIYVLCNASIVTRRHVQIII